MRLSTKGRYAARIMVYMAMRRGDGAVTKREIAKAERISVDYVGQLLMKLVTANLLTSHRGKKGGFSLDKDPGQITMGEVLAATEGSLSVVPCLEGDCVHATECSTRQLWSRINRSIHDILAETTVKQLADDAVRVKRSGALSFDI